MSPAAYALVSATNWLLGTWLGVVPVSFRHFQRAVHIHGRSSVPLKCVVNSLFLFQITLHISYIHAFINPTLFLVLHRGLRQAAFDTCCGCCWGWAGWAVSWVWGSIRRPPYSSPTVPPPPDPPKTSLTDISLLKPPLPPPAEYNSSMVIKCYM